MHQAHQIDFAAGRAAIRARPARQAAAEAIAAQLFRTEKSLEDTALDLNQLHSTLIEARRSAGLATSVGHKLIDEAAAAQAAVTGALAAIVKLHEAAVPQMKALGLPRMDFGDNSKDDVVYNPEG